MSFMKGALLPFETKTRFVWVATLSILLSGLAEAGPGSRANPFKRLVHLRALPCAAKLRMLCPDLGSPEAELKAHLLGMSTTPGVQILESRGIPMTMIRRIDGKVYRASITDEGVIQATMLVAKQPAGKCVGDFAVREDAPGEQRLVAWLTDRGRLVLYDAYSDMITSARFEGTAAEARFYRGSVVVRSLLRNGSTQLSFFGIGDLSGTSLSRPKKVEIIEGLPVTSISSDQRLMILKSFQVGVPETDFLVYVYPSSVRRGGIYSTEIRIYSGRGVLIAKASLEGKLLNPPEIIRKENLFVATQLNNRKRRYFLRLEWRAGLRTLEFKRVQLRETRVLP